MEKKFRVKEIKRIIKENPFLSLTGLGAILGVSRQRVHQILLKNNIRYQNKRSWYPRYSRSCFSKTVRERLTRKEICKTLHISPSSLEKYLKHYNLKWLHRGNQKLEEKALRLVIKERPEWTLKKIGQFFEVHYLTVMYTIRKYKIKYKKKTRYRGSSRQLGS